MSPGLTGIIATVSLNPVRCVTQPDVRAPYAYPPLLFLKLSKTDLSQQA